VVSTQEALVSAVGTHRGTEAADRLCTACVELFSVDAAAISLVFDGTNTGTLGVSSDDARTFDEMQFTVGEGPCMDTVAARAPVLVVDLADMDNMHWPVYGPAMLTHEIRGVFALPVLIAAEYLGALDLFCRLPGDLSEDDLAGAMVAAELAEMPLLDLVGENLRIALEEPGSLAWRELSAITRAEVSQATGMLVAQLEVSPAEALLRLRANAYASARTASEVARDILERRLRLDVD
jgi:hypothetical protein